MRWILCGKNDLAVHVLEYLVGCGDEVRVVGTRDDDGVDGWQRSLRKAAKQHGVPLECPERVNDPAFVGGLADFGADALLSIQYDQILRGSLFRKVGCPCLNLHFSLLPRHRGVGPIAWAILSGDREAGVTLHHMVEGVDAGDVVLQRAVPIGAADTARQLYDRVSEAGRRLFEEAYPFPPELLGRRIVQDASRASYHRQGDLDFSERRTDWSQPAVELQRWLRAWIFPPFQYPETSLDGRTLEIRRVGGEVGAPVAAAAGEVVARDASGLEVAAGGGTIRIAEMVEAGGSPAGVGAVPASIAVGQRFA